MTVQKVPQPPAFLETRDPQMHAYLTQLVQHLQAVLDQLDATKQDLSTPTKFPLLTRANLLTGPFGLRTKDTAGAVMIPDYNGDYALVISSGSDLRVITIGPPLT